jgi:predicted outer membrane protein
MAMIVVSACATTPNYQTAAGTVDLSAYPAVVLDGGETQILRGMSDANILGHLRTIDSLEVATADSALRFSKSDATITYARLMHLTHTDDMKQVRDIGEATRLTPSPDVTTLKASHMAASLDSVRVASDITIDRHYIMSQVQLHSHALAELEVLQGVARSPAVRQHIAAMIPVVRDHLARAHAIAGDKGYEKRRG